MKIVPVTLTEKPAGSFYAQKQNRSAAASWKTQSLRWDRGAAARVCTDVPTPLENTLIGAGRGGGADGYKEAYAGQPTDQSGNLFTSSGLFWKIEHIIPPTHPNPAPAAPRCSRPLVPLCPFGIRTLWLGPVGKGRLPSERGAELILKVPAGRQREGGGGGRGSGIPAPPPLFPQHCSDSMKPSFSWPTGSTSA